MTLLESLLFAFVIGIVGGLWRVADTEDLEEILREGIRLSLVQAGISIKELAFYTGTNESNLRKEINGESGFRLSFFKMVATWPFRFWLFFTPTLLYVIAKKRMAELKDEVGA